MPREVHEETANYTIEWDSDLDAVVHTWTGFTSGQEFRDGSNELLDAIERKDASKLIVDTSGIQAHDDEDKQWLQETWVPKALDAGIEYSAQVHADSVISQMEMEEFDEESSDLSLNTFVTGDMDEAREWIADQ